METKKLLKKVTLKSAMDELTGGALAGAGVIGGSVLMKMSSGKVNPWLVSTLAILAGYGIRITVDNEMAKDAGTGLLIAGILDAAKKAIDQFGTSVPALTNISASIPSLSGPDQNNYLFNGAVRANLQGMRGLGTGVGADQVADANRFSSALFE